MKMVVKMGVVLSFSPNLRLTVLTALAFITNKSVEFKHTAV